MKEVAYKEESISEHPKRERRKLEEGSSPGPAVNSSLPTTTTGPKHVLFEACYPCLARVSWRRGAMIPMRRSKNDSLG